MRKIYYNIILFILFVNSLYTQSELIPINHKIYNFIETMHKKQIIKDYNSANIPISRKEVAFFLKIINENQKKLNYTEQEILKELNKEFEYDINKNIDNSISILSNKNFLINLFDNNKQKYLYAYKDSLANFFLDGTGFISHRQYQLETLGNTFITLAEYGIRIRGSLYDNLGYYLRISSGQQWNGDYFTRLIADKYDTKLHSTTKFLSEKYFETFEGYLRYSFLNDNFSITLGREGINLGTGYIDKLFISSNAAPFDFGKVDIHYKKIKYTYLYGSLRGISKNTVLESKNIISHRVDVGLSDIFRFGIFEAIITANKPINFTYLNPMSFLFSADLSAQNDNTSNSFIGLDFELLPAKNIGIQASFLIDDFDFKYAWKNVPESNNNRFGWQIGLINCDFLGINNLIAKIEYTHLDPFMYSHKSNQSQYTHWGLPLGHALKPNSDEIALNLQSWLTKRININILIQYQRNGEGILYDNNGNIIKNYGADINNSDGLYLSKAYFLDGNRVDYFNLKLYLLFEPIKQIFFRIDYQLNITNKKYISKEMYDNLFYFTFYTDL